MVTFGRLQRYLLWLAPVLLAGFLLVPTTCADASGIHSLFHDPLADVPDLANGGESLLVAQLGMSVKTLEMHVATGHVVLPGRAMDDGPADRTSGRR